MEWTIKGWLQNQPYRFATGRIPSTFGRIHCFCSVFQKSPMYLPAHVREICGVVRKRLASGPPSTYMAVSSWSEEASSLLVKVRTELKAARSFELADLVRDQLTELGIEVRDTKDGADWSFRG